MLDLLNSRPKLKPNLRYVVQRFGDEGCCIVEDPGTDKFWRVGLPEWRLLQRFDGQSTVAQAARCVTVGVASGAEPVETGEDLLDPVAARQVVTWAVQEGLVENLRASQKTPGGVRWMQAINASVFYRLRLCNPQPFLEKIYPLLGWLTNPMLMFAWALVLMIAGAMLVGRWGEFSDATFSVVSPDLWLYYILIWWGLKFVHEIFHGLTCLRYGGNVGEAGILFLLFAPLGAYVDVTSSWRFCSKWQRMHVTFAGIYVELLIAALSVILWCFSEDPLVRQVCLQITVLASVATILFNANPLIRFDGYYLLSDYLEVPNLYTQGQIAVRQVFSRFLFGVDSRLKPAAVESSWPVLIFGVSSFVWRIFLSVGIALAAASLLEGAGLFLAVALVFVWWVVPLLKSCLAIGKLAWTHPFALLRGVLVASMFGVAGYLAATKLRLPRYVAAPGIVRPVNSTVVRAEVSGRIEKLLVSSGERVRKGQILARLQNPDLDLKVLELSQEVQRSELRRLRLIAEGFVAEAQAEEQVKRELQDQLSNRRDQQRSLTLVAPHDGQVTDFDLDGFWGRHMRRGDRFVEIADLEELEFAFSFEQSQLASLGEDAAKRGQAALLLPERSLIECDLEEIDIRPHARYDLQHVALSATKGGPIPVAEHLTESNLVQTRTLTPRVHGTVPLEPDQAIIPGVVGTLRVAVPSQTVAAMLKPWLQRRWNGLVTELFD